MITATAKIWTLVFTMGIAAAFAPAIAHGAEGAALQATGSSQQEEAAKKDPPAKKEAAPSQARRTSSRSRRRTKMRDPFQSLGGEAGAPTGAGGGRRLPPNERGLVISQLQVGGIVLGGRGKIAVVAVQGRDRAFFLREGDRVYDGIVKEIRPDRVIFRERSRDAFGRVIVRDVTKMLTSLPIGSKR